MARASGLEPGLCQFDSDRFDNRLLTANLKNKLHKSYQNQK